MYKALKEIGGFKPGDVVPDDKAEVWLKMFAVPHVEKCEDGVIAEVEPEKVVSEEPKELAMLDDYLARNAGVVKKNIKSDKLSKEILEELLSLESKGRKRRDVMRVIKRELSG